MNLYKITFLHAGPKDRKKGIKGYVLAENEEKVFNYIDETFEHGYWSDPDNEPVDVYDEDFNLIGTETLKEKIIRIKGEINDEDYDFDDAYYGITLYGWELVKENADGDYTEMIELEIIKQI